MIRLGILLLVLAGWAQAATNYYVAPAGNNGNPGSLQNPWQEIQFGCDQLQPGDTLNIRAGIYAEKIDLNASGQSGAWITIRSYQNESAILDAASYTDDRAFFYAESKSFFRVQGLHFQNNFNLSGAGFHVEGAGQSFEILDNTFENIAISADPLQPVNTNTNMPVLLFRGSLAPDSLYNILIRGNTIRNCRPGFSECIALTGNCSGFQILNNSVHDNKNIGIAITGNYLDAPDPLYDQARHGVIRANVCNNNVSDYSASAGIYVDGGMYTLVENNFCNENGFGGEIGCEESGRCANVTFRNNLFANNQFAGMQLGGYDAGSMGYVEYALVRNNTFYHNDTLNDGNGELLVTQFEHSAILNNIFYCSNQNLLMANDRAQPFLTMDYNLIYCDAGEASLESWWNGAGYTGFAAVQASVGMGAHNLFANPQLTDPTAVQTDVHLLPGSPARDAGDPLTVLDPEELDLDGESRLQGTRVDLGVDEFSLLQAVSPLEIHYHGSQVILDWPTSSGANAYRIESRPRQTLPWQSLHTTSDTTYTQTLATPRTFYRVIALTTP